MAQAGADIEQTLWEGSGDRREGHGEECQAEEKGAGEPRSAHPATFVVIDQMVTHGPEGAIAKPFKGTGRQSLCDSTSGPMVNPVA